MAVRLRLKRTGATNQASHRIVAIDKRCSRDGKAIEELGFYDPRHNNEKLNLDRVEYWLKNGAIPSETVSDIIERARKGESRNGEKEDMAKKPSKKALAKEKAEAEKKEAEKAEAEKKEAEKAEAEKAEAEKKEAEKAETEKAEAEKKTEETA